MKKKEEKNNKPIVRQYNDNEWEFLYPPSIDNEKVYNEYWEAVELLDYNNEMAEKIFKRLISKHPYNIDSYNHLSITFRNQNKTFESLLTAEKSYSLGKECFPKEFNFKKDKLIWSKLDNRPFLRACQIYGLECQYHKKYASSIIVYNENLSLNEDDHQGIRYLLLEVFFATKDFKRARQLINKYLNDYSIEFKFGAVVLDILDEKFEKAENNLKIAIKINKFVLAEVIKEKHISPPPFRIPGEPYFDAGTPIGSIQQAYNYWKRNRNLYKTKEIVEYFRVIKKFEL